MHYMLLLYVDDPLLEPSRASTVRIRGARVLRTDGPFAETTEWLGGYFIVDCADLAEAVALAERCPTALVGSVEVRPVMDVAGPRVDRGRRGAVSGEAASAAASDQN